MQPCRGRSRDAEPPGWPLSFISYAQNCEDVLLWRAFRDLPRGFYIDAGAQDPDVDSVTRAFYDRGWSGVNVEPVADYHARLVRARPRDMNLCAALGATRADTRLYEIPESGLSTTHA